MKRRSAVKSLLLIAFILLSHQGVSQENVARDWRNILHGAIDNDFAIQAVQARNIYHTAICITHDMWATFEDNRTPILLGNQMDDY